MTRCKRRHLMHVALLASFPSARCMTNVAVSCQLQGLANVFA